MPTNTSPSSSCSISRRVAFVGCAISSAYSRSRVRTSRAPVVIVSRTGCRWMCSTCAQRALRLGIEPAQRLDVVAEQLDADRMRRERRVDVDHATAQRERAWLVDDWRARPATGDQQRRDLIAIDRLALLIVRPRDASSAGAHRPPRQCLRRRDDELRPQRRLGQPVQRRDALDDPRAIRRQVRVRRDIDPRQRRDRIELGGIALATDEEPHVALERTGRGIVGRDHHDQLLAGRELRGEPGRPARASRRTR